MIRLTGLKILPHEVAVIRSCKNILLKNISQGPLSQFLRMSTLSDSQHKYDPLTNNASTAIKEVRLPLTETSQSKKTTEEDTICVQTPNNDLRSLISHYKGLSKFRLTSLVVLTAVGGYAMAPMPFDITSFLLCTLGTGLLSAGANSINQYHEVPFDAQMARTKHRVLVTGKVTRLHAVGFAITCASMGLSMLYFGVNGLTAALGLSNFILYTSIYTPMKRTSILNTWVGSVVGAIPPLMGWAACTGTLDSGAWILAGLLYAWQFPHFNALSWNLRPDYKRAGYQMMAVSHPGLCRRTALRYTFVIAGLSMVAPLCDLTNSWFALETLPLNIYFIYLAYKFYQKSDSGTSRKLFRFSLVHLPALMLLLLFNKKEWFISKESKLSSTDDTTQIDKVAIPESFKLAEKKDTLLQVLVPPNRQHIVPAAITTNSET